MNPERSRWITLYVLCAGTLMIVLDVTVVNVALPYIKADLGFPDASLAWVVNAYMIAFGGLLLLAGRLGDLFGRLRIFLVGLAIFTLASVVCGLAQDQLVLVVARFVQGSGGALTSSVTLGMIVTIFSQPHEQAKAIGVFAFVATAGGAVGLLAGRRADPSHQLALDLLHQRADRHRDGCLRPALGAGRPGQRLADGIDLAGAVLITAALMLGVYTIVKPAADDGWTSAAHPRLRGGQPGAAGWLPDPRVHRGQSAGAAAVSSVRATSARPTSSRSSERLASSAPSSSARYTCSRCCITARCGSASRSCRCRC